MVDPELACPRGRVQTKPGGDEGAVHSSAMHKPLGADPAPVWRVIRGYGNEGSTINLDLLHLVEADLDRRLPTEDRHEHLELCRVLVDLRDLTREVRERP